MDHKILVIGGYGSVGREICRELGEKYPGRIIAAGRNFKKAEELSKSTSGKVLPLHFDLSESSKIDVILDNISTVVMCVEQEDISFAERCLEKGINYIDISASYDFLSKVLTLDDKAKQSGATSIISVGLVPGMSNLLAKYSTFKFDKVDQIDIFVMLGLGEKHGKAAIDWTIDNMNSEFNVIENGQYKRVKSFEDGKKVTFSDILRERTAYRFNFSDQHVLPVTLGIGSVSTRLCFDSKALTNFIALLKRIGFFNLLNIGFFKSNMIKLFEKFNFGSELFAVKVCTKGWRKNKYTSYECMVSGYTESIATARVAAILVQSMLLKKFPYGVYHIEQLFDPAYVFRKIEDTSDMNFKF